MDPRVNIVLQKFSTAQEEDSVSRRPTFGSCCRRCGDFTAARAPLLHHSSCFPVRAPLQYPYDIKNLTTQEAFSPLSRDKH